MLIGLPVKTWQQVVLGLTNIRAEPASEVVPKATGMQPALATECAAGRRLNHQTGHG
jgi:hypothetical protein